MILLRDYGCMVDINGKFVQDSEVVGMPKAVCVWRKAWGWLEGYYSLGGDING
jgi:hypothetical protein